jgi:hypothetical protein
MTVTSTLPPSRIEILEKIAEVADKVIDSRPRDTPRYASPRHELYELLRDLERTEKP